MKERSETEQLSNDVLKLTGRLLRLASLASAEIGPQLNTGVSESDSHVGCLNAVLS